MIEIAGDLKNYDLQSCSNLRLPGYSVSSGVNSEGKLGLNYSIEEIWTQWND